MPKLEPIHTLDSKDAISILSFLHVSERLKNEIRHSFTSTGRTESVAEHSWRTVLIAVVLKPYLPHSLDWERLLEMLVVHDIVEAKTGDIPLFDSVRNMQKRELERAAMDGFVEMLPASVGAFINSRWEEFESKQTVEAKIAQSLDKLEAQLQHNEASLSTWLEWEKRRVFGGLDAVAKSHPVVETLKDVIVQEAIDKLVAAGEDITRLSEKNNPAHA